MYSKINLRRIMISSPSSNSGKTLVTCALMNILKDKFGVKAFKCGPDFIDPLFHEKILGLSSVNLDSYFEDKKNLLNLFLEESADSKISVIEGAMGYFDGIGGTLLKASSYDIARITKTPVILIIDAKGMSRSVCALIKGYLNYVKPNFIKGVILNKISKSLFLILKNMIENECDVKVLGFLPYEKKLEWQSRHLGLFLPAEIKNFEEQINLASSLLKDSFDEKEFLKIINAAPKLKSYTNNEKKLEVYRKKYSSLKIAIAKDDAFCFYYKKNISMIKECFVQVRYFSPLSDKEIPDCDGIIFGGGYPELFADRLEKNVSLISSVQKLVKDKIPVLAECGGFMYLQKSLLDKQKNRFNMCGILEGESFFCEKLVRFGYAEYTDRESKLTIKGHEFHYFDSTSNGEDFLSKKASGKCGENCIVKKDNIIAGFPHLYYNSRPEFLYSFLDKCLEYRAYKNGK